MTVVVKELIESRGIRRERAGNRTGMRRFAVYDDGQGTPITAPSHVNSLFGQPTSPDTLPPVGSAFPDFPELQAFETEIHRAPGHTDLWHVNIGYFSTEIVGGPPPGEIGYVTFNLDQTAEFRDVYRNNPDIDAIAPFGNPIPGRHNILGFEVDASGEPTSQLRGIQDLTITEIVPGALANFPLYSAMKGRRNNVAFYGANPGRILYRGASSATAAMQRISITHRFSWDDEYHMKQVPRRDGDGNPVKIKMLDAGESFYFAKHVYWVQPFPNLADFNALSEFF